jgi:hypothetical protein
MFVSLLFGSCEQTNRFMGQPAAVVGFESRARECDAHRRCIDIYAFGAPPRGPDVRVPTAELPGAITPYQGVATTKPGVSHPLELGVSNGGGAPGAARLL